MFFRSHHGETQFLVNASLVEQITDILTNESLPYEVLVDDFQTVVDDEMKQIQDSSENFKFRNPGDVPDPRKQFNLFNYHRLDDIYQYLNQVINNYFQTSRYSAPILTYPLNISTLA